MPDSPPPDDRYRLPRTVVPQHYDLVIAPDLDASSFEATATVSVQVTEPVTAIVCNAADLAIHSAVLVDAGGVQQQGDVEHDAETERVTVRLASPAAVGPATLTFTHSGTLNDKLRGFYRSTFTDRDGETQVIATTQFEATDARRAFPCWDEPDAKATFEVELRVPAGLVAVSNTSVARERPADDGATWVRFHRTIPMSTYLAAWVIGPLELTAPVDVDGVALRVVCPPGRAPLAQFALEAGGHALRFFTDYFGIPYPGDKLDLVALPDFAFGAMENFGCVTFRETGLLVDPSTASRLDLERVADVVSHEIAHMWFGDLVTMKWWNGIWLNEAFATFMEVSCVEAFRPEWQRWVSFSTGRAAAMGVDALATTRPIEFPVVSPDDAEGMFDLLTYEKGGAVLRMLETYLGAERFRDGIRHYLVTHRYGNTETTDLWDALEATTGEPVRAMMDTWIFQGGHPEVSVERADVPTSISLSQRRFRFAASDEDAAARWHIPVLVRSTSGGGWTHRRTLLTESASALDLGGDVDRVVVNDGGWGFFRTRYSQDLLRRVIDEFDGLTPIERFNLVTDTWSAVLAGHAPLEDFLSLARRLGDETDESVWEAALEPLDLLHRIVADADRDAVSGFIHSLVEPAFARLGWEPGTEENERTGSVRATLLSALATIGDDHEARHKSMDLHAAYLEGRGQIAPDLVPALVSITAWAGGQPEYDSFRKRSADAATPQEEVRYLYALARFRPAELMRQTLDLALTEVRTQNAPFLIGVALGNRWRGPEAWDWLREHWDEALARFPDNTTSRMLDSVVLLTAPDVAASVKEFLAAHPVPHAQRLVAQILERLDVNAAFRAREAGRLDDTLRSVTG